MSKFCKVRKLTLIRIGHHSTQIELCKIWYCILMFSAVLKSLLKACRKMTNQKVCSLLINKLIGGLTPSMFCRVRQISGLTCFFSSNGWGCCQSIFLPTYSLMAKTLRNGSWFNLKSEINKLSPIYQMLSCSYHSIKNLLDNTGSTHAKNWSTRSTNKATKPVILYLAVSLKICCWGWFL